MEPHQWLSGWWYTYPSEKYIRSSVGMNIPNNQYKESYEIHVPNHQPVMEPPKPVSPWHHLLLLRFRRLLLRPQFLHHRQQLRKTFAVRRQQGTLRSSGNEKKGEVWEKKHGLDGGWPTPLKNMSSSVGMMTFPIYEKKTCSKPPISMDWSFQKMELVSQSMGNCYSWFKIWLKFDLSFLRQSLEKHLRARCTMILAWPLRLCLWLPLSLTLANVSPACENIEHQIQ